MGYTIPINIFLSEVQWQIIKDYEINVLQVCVEAIAEAVDSRSVMKAAIHGVSSSYEEIQALRIENARLEKIIKVNKHYPMIEIYHRRAPIEKPKIAGGDHEVFTTLKKES